MSEVRSGSSAGLMSQARQAEGVPRVLHIGKRIILGLLAALVAATAIPSALYVVPELPREWLLRGPFADYTIPAIALGLVVGGSAAAALIAAFLRPTIAALASAFAGLMIIGFELVQIVVVGLAIVTHGVQYPQSWLQLVYLAVGGAQLVVAYRLWRAAHPARPLSSLAH